MANVLNTDKQIAIIAALSEESSIRSLHIPPVVSPQTAVQAVIVQENKDGAN